LSFISDYITKKIESGEKILSAFLTAGFPDKDNFVKLAVDVLNSGADLLEIGFPFSDPLADGPIIQASSQTALQQGITLNETFKYAEAIRKETDKPLILMGYANPVLNYGIDKFASDASNLGIAGVIIPDIPIEEYDNFFTSSFDNIDIILLVTPTTSPERIKAIDEKSRGFVYCVSTSGTTGNFSKKAADNLEFIKNTYSLVRKNKMLVGFGISNAADAKLYSAHSDGVIVGSAIIKSLMSQNGNYKETLRLISELKQVLRN